MPGREFESKGQMTVEFAVVFPVAVMLAMVVFGTMAFMSECAAFDVAARDAIRLQADDGYEGAASSAEVIDRISSASGIPSSAISVSSTRTVLGHLNYTAAFTFTPSAFGIQVPSSVFGMAIPQLRHEVHFTISPYRKGIVI